MSNIPRKEYPRPQFVRENWINLNGTWAFEIDNGRSGEARGLQKVGTALSGEITVPFCPESELSGVQHTDFMYGVWYKRTVTVTEKQLKGRAVLHFGAVDYCAKVFVNGELAGTHKGGYVSFEFDVTALLKAGENEIAVYAEDNTRDRSSRAASRASNITHTAASTHAPQAFGRPYGWSSPRRLIFPACSIIRTSLQAW